MVRKIAFWSLGLLMGLALVGCDSGTDSGTPVSSADLVGKWYLRKVQVGLDVNFKGNFLGAPIDTTSHFDTTQDYDGTQYFIEFKSEGNAFTSVFPDDLADAAAALKRSAAAAATETGTWSVSGDMLTLVASDGTTEKVQVSISGSTLTGKRTLDSTATQNGLTVHRTGSTTLSFSK
jgi:hypothetical protein